jgi:glutamine phosphoribosylpyrophosphate amidotransferase
VCSSDLESGIPFELGIIRSHYVGRTFIQPGDKVRHLGVKLKHNANRALIDGKKIVLIDDSIVRGTTSLKIVQMMREAGAAEVHMRIASPPTRHSCFYGVDTPERTKLLAHKLDVGGMKDFIHADSLAFLSIDGLYKALGEAKRADIRPLVMGRLGDAVIFASETVAFDVVGAEYIRQVEPGELIVVPHGSSAEQIRSHRPFGEVHPRPCIFEHVYFSRPDSIVDGSSVYSVRKAIGAQLAQENPVEADYVIPVPDSGVPAAIGYAQQSGIPFELGIIRSHYIGRTFIQPGDQVRHLGVKLKHNANRALIDGKRIVLIDDSIVRGTTSLKIVQMMREAGAKEVHMRIASPPTRHSCFYGVDTPERTKLLAHKLDIGGMRDFIHADSLSFLSIDGLYKALGEAKRADIRPQYCDACFTGDYPTSLTDQDEAEVRDQLELLSERVV